MEKVKNCGFLSATSLPLSTLLQFRPDAGHQLRTTIPRDESRASFLQILVELAAKSAEEPVNFRGRGSVSVEAESSSCTRVPCERDRLRPISTSASFFFRVRPIRLRPISTLANFDFGQFRLRPIFRC